MSIYRSIALSTLSTLSLLSPLHAQNWEWSGWGGGGFFWSAAWDPSDENTLYLGGDVLGAYKSTDRGKTWRIINNGIQDYGVYSLAVAKSDPRVVYAMTQNGVARSDNAGESWNRLPESMNTSKRLSITRGQTVRGIAIDPRDAKVVYAGSGRGEVHKSTDGGETWEKLDFLSAMPPEEPVEGPAAARGKGFLYMRYNSPGNDWTPHGRVEKYLNPPEDWSGFEKLSAKFLAPANAPRLTAFVVAQNGSDWKWQEGPGVDLKPGEWTEASIELSKIANPADVRLAHLVVRANGNRFSGDIGIDDVRLLADGKERVIGDWEVAADLDGWRKSTANDARFAQSFFSSLAPVAAPAVVSPVASVVVAEANPGLVFVCNRRLGLFRSADGGATWTKPDTPANAAHVAVHAKDANIAYGAFGGEVWKSVDAGVTWQKLEGSAPANHRVIEVAMDPRDSNVVHFIASGSWSGMYGVTRDGGATWATGRGWTRDADSNRTLPVEPVNPLSTPTNLAMSPSNPDCLFISANWNNIMTTDGGASWRQRDTGADITCFHDIRFANGSIFAVAMDEGLFRSDNNGATWTHLAPLKYEEGLSGHQWRVNVLPRDGAFRVISTVSAWRGSKEYPNYVLLSDDGGKTFTRSREGLPDYLPKANAMWGEGYARALATDPNNPEILYLGIDGDPEAGKMGGGIFKSVDGGKTWAQLPNQPGSRCMFYGLAVDPTDSNRILWGAGDQGKKGVFGLWISGDAGGSWIKTPVNEWIFNVEITPSGTMYAGGNNLWQSLDSGKTWKQITQLENLCAIGIAVDPENEDRVWCGFTNWGTGDSGGVYRSDDKGRTWTEITGDIGYRKPLVLRYNPAMKELWAAGVGAYKIKQ